MTTAYFSPSLNCFIPAQWKIDGTYNDITWPTDAVAATDAEIATYWKVNPPEGKMLGNDGEHPVWVDLPIPSKEELIAIAEETRGSLISSAMDSVSFIHLKLQAGRTLTESETSKLNKTIDYMDALSSIDTNSAPDIDWPAIAE